MAQSVQQFTEQVTKSSLIPADELAALLESLPPDRKADAEQLARELVRQKKLTAFQVQQIYQGKGKHLVLGNYVVLDKLGQGGMGMVLKAQHQRMKRLVALKMLSPAVTKTPEALRRFQREVEAAAKLRHQNIVAADDADEAAGTHFLVMEYVEGTDLSELVKKNGPLPVEKAIACIVQAARGLEYAHASGVVHRDIKPANLLLDNKGTVKILDMGLARIDNAGANQDDLTGTGQIMGTIDYMSPEQALDTKSADARADIYSLGITLWYLLTGRPVYEGTSTMAKLLAHRERAIPSLRDACSAAPPALDAVFARMVAKTVESRYQSMTECIADLERCRTGQESSPSLGTNPGEDSRLSEFLRGMGQGGAGHGTAVARQTMAATAPTAAFEQTVDLSDARIGTDPQTQQSLPQTALNTLAGRRAAGQAWLDRLPVPPKYRLPVLIGGGLAAAALLLAGILLFWQTDQGTVRIEINDPNITVQVDGAGAKITQLDKDPIELAPGRHGLRIKYGNLDFGTDKFVLADGDDVRLKVELLAGQVRVANGDEPLDVKPISPIADASSTSASGGRQPPGDRASGAPWHGWPADAPVPAIAPFDVAQAKKHQQEWADYLGVPVEYENSIGMKFALIPPGEFLMGGTAAEIDAALVVVGTDEIWKNFIRSEAPRHNVVLTQPIYLGTHEVTQAQYEQVMGTNPSYFSATGEGKEAVANIGTRSFPVEQVSWSDAAELCAKLSEKEVLKPFYSRSGETVTTLDGNGYRLPTEAEWEFACRAGTTTRFWIGDQDESLVQTDWLGSNAGGRIHAVGELKPNPLGLFDVHGNVWEWVQDWEEGDYYRQFAETPAIDPSGPFSAGSQRVIRGGDWRLTPSYCRSSTRYAFDPTIRFNNIGFRVVLTVEAVKQKLADAPAPAIAPFDAAQAKKHQQEWAEHLGVPVEYENSIGMKFVLVPPGEFTMGSTPEELEAALVAAGSDENWKQYIRSEAPRHKVVLSQPIYLGVREVTQAQYEQVMGANPSHFAASGGGKDAVARMDTSTHAVEQVGWNDAAEFCAKLSEKEELKPFYIRSGETVTLLEGDGYRLPTEAQWEFACRAGTTTRFWCGETDDDLVQAGWSGSNSGGRTHAVGELKANPLGLYDLHGNVWEWVQDWWEANYYAQFPELPALDPCGPSSAGSLSMIRGGRWGSHPSYCRSSSRYATAPTTRADSIGFRVALASGAVKAALDRRATQSVDGASALYTWPADAPAPAIAPFDAAQAKRHQEEWAEYLKVPAEWENSVGMKFMLIPPGEFLMGSTAAEIDAALVAAGTDETWKNFIRSEAPQHNVVLTQPIYLGIHEVTQAQYEQVMGTNPSHFSATGPGKDAVANVDTRSFPVEMVSWNDAVDFCAKLTEKEQLEPFYFHSGETVTMLDGNGYRLPTEAQWEFACRAGTTTRFWIGDQDESLVQAGWISANARGRTHAAGELQANRLGLFDVHGNVWEWVQDWWEPAYYGQFQEKPAIDPGGPSFTGSQRVVRGGNWSNDLFPCRSSFHFALVPTSRYYNVGFRVVLPVEAVKSASPTVVDVLGAVRLPDDEVDQVPFSVGWTREGDALVSPGGNRQGLISTRLQPPSEYEITAVVERVAGNDGLLFGVVVDGHPCCVAFDVGNEKQCGVGLIDGKEISDNESSVKGAVLTGSRPLTIRITCGARSVRASVDDKEIVRWEGDPGRLSAPGWVPAPKNIWFAAAYHRWKFHKLEVRPLGADAEKSLPP